MQLMSVKRETICSRRLRFAPPWKDSQLKRLEVTPTPEAIADSIANDTANRNDELVDFIKLIDSIEGPYSLLLDAPWGDGKSFFVRSVEEVLKTLNPHISSPAGNDQKLARVTKELEDIETPYLPFYFNAWEHDFADDPISALFASMAVTFDSENLTVAHSSRKIIASIVDAALAATPISIRVSDVAEALSGESLISAYEERAKLRDLIDELAERCIVEVANKLVIIIDELDRCRPDFAVRLLEQTKSLFQNENVFVIISADSLQLAHATAGLYGDGFDSQHFIERFFDLRITLAPTDSYMVATGEELHDTSHDYDLMKRSLFDAHRLTIRDCARIHEKLVAGRQYCDASGDGGLAVSVAACLILPVLIFLERDDIELFRQVTRGADFDALYDYAVRFDAFSKILDKYLGLIKSEFRTKEVDGISDEERRRYVHSLCVWLFAKKRNSQTFYEAHSSLGSPRGIDRTVFMTLRFPDE